MSEVEPCIYRVCVFQFDCESLRFLLSSATNYAKKGTDRSYVEIIKDKKNKEDKTDNNKNSDEIDDLGEEKQKQEEGGGGGILQFSGGMKFANNQDTVHINNLRLFRLTSILVLCAPSDFKQNPHVSSDLRHQEESNKNLNEEDAEEEGKVPVDLSRCFGLEFVSEDLATAFLQTYNSLTNNISSLSCPSSSSSSSAGVSPSPCCLPGDHISRMDPSVVQAYFQYYGKMTNQMNMLQDNVRTSLYQKAMLENTKDFKGKNVMDVGAGSGILSFFAAQSGAAQVYAVEASSMAQVISLLSETNDELGKRIKVINKMLEKITDEDLNKNKMDVLVSEPIGIFLFNERMIETYLDARDKFLKPGGRMFPNRCQLAVAPFTDQALFNDVSTRSQFWRQTNFYGVNLSNAFPRAYEEQFRQPIVDYVDPSILVCPPHLEEYDFETIDKKALEHIEFSFDFVISYPCLIHGIAGWFDVLFEGSEQKQPLAVNAGQTVTGRLSMQANNQQSYFLHIKMHIAGTDIMTETTTIDLKDQDYRYYTNPSSTYVPNCYTANQMCSQNAGPPAPPQNASGSQNNTGVSTPHSSHAADTSAVSTAPWGTITGGGTSTSAPQQNCAKNGIAAGCL